MHFATEGTENTEGIFSRRVASSSEPIGTKNVYPQISQMITDFKKDDLRPSFLSVSSVTSVAKNSSSRRHRR